MPKQQPIGFMDSGVGGLSVILQAQKILPHEDLVFIGDQARLPYGTKTTEQVQTYSFEMAKFLIEKRQIKALVIACNTATAAALPQLQETLNIPVIGVIKPGSQAAVLQTKNKKIGVIATQATIASQAYDKQIKAFDATMQVSGLATQLFVTMAEANQVSGETAQQQVTQALKPLATTAIDTLVLGCTHFPFLKSLIQQALPNPVVLIDPAESTVEVLKDQLKQQNQLNDQTHLGQLECFTTADVKTFETLASDWLQRTDLKVSLAKL